jgi:glutamyl-tRNA synthetase
VKTVEKVKETAIKYAVLNATQHEGKAQTGSVMGRIMAEFPDLRTSPNQVISIINEVVALVNSWSLEKQLKRLEDKWPELLERNRVAEKEKLLPPLENIEKYPVIKTRFAPNPDGALHLGSAEPIIFCDEYAKMYNGKFILRFEDTSSDVKPPILEMYGFIEEDLKWLDVKVDEKYIQSDRIQIYHKYAKKLLEKGNAYVCMCDPPKFRELYMEKISCPCRDISTEKNLERWKKMLDGTYAKGEAVVRIKTDIQHPNPAIRDWPALRISDTFHPRVGKKHRVWPLYNFSCAIDDHLTEVSHIIRGKEHDVNTTRQKYIYKYFGWEYPDIINVGRVGLEDVILSKSRMREGIEEGIYEGWDDPRLGSLIALRRRGLQPETIRKIMIQIGPKPINVMLSWDNIAAENRKLIDPNANRYTFIRNPVKLSVTGLPEKIEAHLPLHPDFPSRGSRDYEINPTKDVYDFNIPLLDAGNFKPEKIVRLMGLMNVEIISVKEKKVFAKFHSKNYQEARKVEAPFINWLPLKTGVPAVVIMPDASKAEGVSEKQVKELVPDTMIQFERFGFVRVDSSDPFVAYFTHK